MAGFSGNLGNRVYPQPDRPACYEDPQAPAALNRYHLLAMTELQFHWPVVGHSKYKGDLLWPPLASEIAILSQQGAYNLLVGSFVTAIQGPLEDPTD